MRNLKPRPLGHSVLSLPCLRQSLLHKWGWIWKGSFWSLFVQAWALVSAVWGWGWGEMLATFCSRRDCDWELVGERFWAPFSGSWVTQWSSHYGDLGTRVSEGVTCGSGDSHLSYWELNKFFKNKYFPICYISFVVVQLLSHVQLFGIPWTALSQAFLFFTVSQSLLKLTSIESVMPSNRLILCLPLLLLPSVFPTFRAFSSELARLIRWPKYWSFNFSISPSKEYSGLISFDIDWLDLLAV